MPAHHSPHDLRALARERLLNKRPDATLNDIEHVWCVCGAPMTSLGLLHIGDCEGDDSDIRFRLKSAKD